jgi:L-threonylcarbamoyladenylate synthase
VNPVPLTVLSAGPQGLAEDDAARLAGHLREGGLVIFPTETLYGLGALVQGAGLKRVLALKGRDASRPIPILVSDRPALDGLVIDALSAALARAFWPGPLTLVLDDPEERFPPGVRSADGGVAARVSSSPVARTIVAALGGPLTATSANPAGEAPATDLASALTVAGRLGGAERGIWVVDGGPLPQSPPSTVVDCRAGELRILREGAVPEEDVRHAAVAARTAEEEVGG